MKLHPDDPRLTAYILGELSPKEADAVERAEASDPAIHFALREIESVQLLLQGSLSPGESALLPRQRQSILRAARQADQGGKIPTLDSHRRTPKPWLIPLATAAVVAIAALILLNLPARESRSTASRPTPHVPALPKISSETDDLPRADSAENSELRGTAASDSRPSSAVETPVVSPPEPLPTMVPRGPVLAADLPILPLPVHAGHASLEKVKHAIREEDRLPATAEVRLEEILNVFPIRLTGAAAISKGVSISTELMPCPWKPSATLLIVSLRGSAKASHEINASYEADPAAVNRYRILGYHPIENTALGPIPTRLDAGKTHTLVVEIEATSGATQLGNLRWSVDGFAAPEIVLHHRSDTEPSDDARFASLVCIFSQWLAKEQAGVIEADIVGALARELVSDDLPPERSDLLNLIFQALKL